MASLKYSANSDLQTVTLGSSYTAGAGSLVLTAGHGARLPSTGDFWLRSESPYVCFKVTARSTDTLTVTAGADGTSDTNLSAGATLHWVLGVAALDQLRGDLLQTGANASKSAEKAGNIYLPNDGFHLFRDTGAAFAAWGPIWPCTIQDFSGYTQINAGAAVFQASGSGYMIYGPASASDNVRALVASTPATPYTVTIGFLFKCVSNYNTAGLAWRQSSDGKLDLLGIQYFNGIKVIELKYTNATTYSAARNTFGYPGGNIAFLRITDNGTNRITYYSLDGYYWVQINSYVRTDFLTPDQVGIFVNTVHASDTAQMTVFHYKIT